MALTLITGLPGHGKTLYALSRYKDEAEKLGRPVFHNNIPGLNIPGWQVWDTANWQQLPANALMIVDECWKDFPVRGRGEPPSHIAELARHRHLGIDFVLIAQDPMLLDSFVRRLVERHFHIVRKFGTRFATIHEYVNGVRDSVSKSRGDSIKHEWRYPAKVFDWYTSAEVHTVKRRIPMRVWLLLAVVLVLPVLVYATYLKLRPTAVAAQLNRTTEADMARNVPPGQLLPPGRGSSGARAVSLTPLEYAQQYIPRVPGYPHTAPVYDDVTKPVRAPYPAACLSMPSKKLCKCYSQQATALDVEPAMCQQIAAGGFFVAWGQDAVKAVPLAAPVPPPGQVTAAGFSPPPPAFASLDSQLDDDQQAAAQVRRPRRR